MWGRRWEHGLWSGSGRPYTPRPVSFVLIWWMPHLELKKEIGGTTRKFAWRVEILKARGPLGDHFNSCLSDFAPSPTHLEVDLRTEKCFKRHG